MRMQQKEQEFVQRVQHREQDFIIKKDQFEKEFKANMDKALPSSPHHDYHMPHNEHYANVLCSCKLMQRRGKETNWHHLNENTSR